MRHVDVDNRATARHWAKIGTQPRSGVALPLFSLRTSRSVGIGDVGDLHALVDWCKAIGSSVIQVLPLNDMGPGSAPYASISAFATDPIYIALDRVPAISEDADLAAQLDALRVQLERAPRVEYDRVRAEKMRMLELGFARVAASLKDDADFTAWTEANADWLEDYVLYRALREDNDWRGWEDWGPYYATDEALATFSAANAERLQFHRWHQWVIDAQLVAARAYANENGVLLKGDIPILVGRDSADVWRNREYFLLDTQAGAPPDYYSADGQAWGFPTYDWDALWADDARWWRRRLAHAERYFDIYRVDHVVGLFRIWTIPEKSRSGQNGWFVPGDEAVWGEHGRRILQLLLDSSEMLPLAEDLGTIPDVCRDTLADMAICGTKVVRWERRWQSDQGFIPEGEYPAASMTTLSTHDSETLRGWWHAYPDQRQVYWNALGYQGEAPAVLSREVHEQILARTAASGSVFVIHAIQDLIAPFGLLEGTPADNRVNLPGTVNDRNWSWRLPMTIERLLENGDVNARLESLLRR